MARAAARLAAEEPLAARADERAAAASGELRESFAFVAATLRDFAGGVTLSEEYRELVDPSAWTLENGSIPILWKDGVEGLRRRFPPCAGDALCAERAESAYDLVRVAHLTSRFLNVVTFPVVELGPFVH